MKKIIALLALITGATTTLFAQKTAEQQTFEINPEVITRVFYVNLDKGDKIKFELGDISDLNHINNIDSLVRAFIQDLEPLKDSLGNELYSRRIDYVADGSGKNKIRIQQFAPKGSSYVSSQGNIASLKLEQDTVNFILKAIGGPQRLFTKQTKGFHYYSISFYLNDIGNLAGYLNGKLQESVNELKKNATEKWVKGNDGLMHSKASPSLSANMMNGQIGINDYLNLRVSADIQNYKNYFVPSLSASVILVTQRTNFIKREFSFTGESHFTFARNSEGKLQTFRSGFLTLGYSVTNTGKTNSHFGFSPSFSLGYLVRQRGDVFDKNTFRLGFGKVGLFNGLIKLEPVIYFNNFFKSVSPGIRLSM